MSNSLISTTDVLSGYMKNIENGASKIASGPAAFLSNFRKYTKSLVMVAMIIILIFCLSIFTFMSVDYNYSIPPIAWIVILIILNIFLKPTHDKIFMHVPNTSFLNMPLTLDSTFI